MKMMLIVLSSVRQWRLRELGNRPAGWNCVLACFMIMKIEGDQHAKFRRRR